MTEQIYASTEAFGSPEPNRYEFTRLHAEYRISSFTEQDDPEATLRAQQIQGQSYVASGFVHESALDEWGRLQPELDRSRGDNVTYFLGISQRDERNQAAVRVVEKPLGAPLDEVAAYHSSADVITPEYKSFLEDYEEVTGGKIQEISGLSNTGKTASLGSFEMIREVFQRSVRDESLNLWIITFVPSAYKAIRGRFGDRVVERISSDLIEIDKTERHMPDELRLTPVIVRTANVLENLLISIEEAPSTRHAIPYIATLEFMSDGLLPDELPPRVHEYFMNQQAMSIKGA